MSLSPITISNQKLEELRALVTTPHDHYEGQNECRFCDRSVLDLAIEKIKSLDVIVQTQQKQIERLLTARDAEKLKGEQMREALNRARYAFYNCAIFDWKAEVTDHPNSPKWLFHEIVASVDHALSSDCGKGWRSPEDYAALEAKWAKAVADMNAIDGCWEKKYESLEAKCAELQKEIALWTEQEAGTEMVLLRQRAEKAEAKCAEMREAQIKFPDNLSALTVGLVLSFAQAMADKLSAAQIKHGYGDGWAETTHEWPIPECHEALMSHLKKGDPVDVANFCAFLWYHKIGTTDCGKDSHENEK